MKTKPKPKRGRGQPRKPESERALTVGVVLSPAQRATAARIGSGSMQDGIRRLLDQAVATA